jgi:hypothetical protein
MLEFLRFELRYQSRHVAFWATCGAFLLLGFGSTAVPGLIFSKVFGAAHANAPSTVALYLGIFSLITLISGVGFAAEPVLRDFQTGMADILHALPVNKPQYVLGRFAAGLLLIMVPFVLAALGSAVGTRMPWLDNSSIGPVTVFPYVWGVLVMALPNAFVIAAINATLATKTKSMAGVFVGVFALFMLWIVAGVLALGTNFHVAALIDPFGGRALSAAARALNPADINSSLPALSGELLTNRVVWLAIGAVLITYSLISFDRATIADTLLQRELSRQARAKDRVARAIEACLTTALKFTPARYARRVGQFLQLTATAYQLAVTNWAFLAVLGLALIALAAGASQIGSVSRVHPVTYWMLSDLKQVMGVAGLVIAVFSAGELVFRDRDARTQDLIDVLPVPVGLRILSNVVTLALLIATAFAAGVGLLICLQVANGTVLVELSSWAMGAAIIFVPVACYGLIALALQMVINHRLIGYIAFAALGLVAYLTTLSPSHDAIGAVVIMPALRDSDLNGFGAPLLTFWVASARLVAVAVLSMVLAARFKSRGAVGRGQVGWSVRVAAAFLVTLLLALTAALSPMMGFHTGGQEARADAMRRAAYEREFRSLLGTPQPVITSVTNAVDIYPDTLQAHLSGTYTIENRTAVPISALQVRLNPRARYRLDMADEGIAPPADSMFVVQNMTKPLQPGESRILSFQIDLDAPRLANDSYSDMVLRHGTLIPSFSVLPQIGYDSQAEISDPAERANQHLDGRNGSTSRDQTMLGPNVVFLDRFDTTISTSDDQMAIAPGVLQTEWHKDGRRYFHYVADGPVLPAGGFMSGDWVAREATTHGKVKTIVYGAAAHQFNVDQMNKAIGATLDYLSEAIAPYPYSELRLVEFPRYAAFAESFPAMVPFSESLGFIGDLEAQGSPDYASYIAAHEVAHQWWAQRMIGADAPGSAMLTESLAQYSALMVMKKLHGDGGARPYLRNELQAYLGLRKSFAGWEPALIETDGQRFLAYNKGALVFYRISQEIGEKTLNEALQSFFIAHQGKGPPYPTAQELAQAVIEKTPDEKRSLIAKLFNSVVVYDNSIESAVATQRPDGKWTLVVHLHLRKLEASQSGVPVPVAYDEPIEVSAVEQTSEHEADDKEILKVSQVAPGPDVTISMTTRNRPDKAVTDFAGKLIDVRPSAESRAVSNQ